MFVSSMLPEERAAVGELAQLAQAELDIDRELQRAWARLWVARTSSSERDPAGFLLAWAVADELHLINIATHPERRRRGVARALMQTLLEHARASRVRLVLLEVRRSNRAAIELYRSHGFRAMGVRRGYYSDTSEDAIEMMLALDPKTGNVIEGTDEVRLP